MGISQIIVCFVQMLSIIKLAFPLPPLFCYLLSFSSFMFNYDFYKVGNDAAS